MRGLVGERVNGLGTGKRGLIYPYLSLSILIISLFCTLSPALCPLAFAQLDYSVQRESIAECGFPGMKTKISLDIRDMDMVSFLKFIAIEGDLNIVASKLVTGPVNLLINDVTIGDALEIVLSMNKFAYEIRGNVIKIMANEEYKSMYGVEFYDKRQTFTYQLRYASVKNVATMLGNIKSEIGKIVYDESTGTIVLIDTPEKIKEMQDVIKQQEMPTITRIMPTQTKVFELQYAKVDDIKGEVSKILTTDIGMMRTDMRTNTLVVTDLPYKIDSVRTVVKAFDRKTREVFIEAKIVEVTLGDKFQWGVDWERAFKLACNGARYTLTPEISLPLALTETYSKLSFATLKGANINAVIEMLGTVTETKILSNPHLTVQEGKEASIKVIEKQPYQEETTTTASGGTTTSSKTYQWVDVGVTLNVTPSINKDGFICLLIKPEVSSISTWYGGEAQSAGAVPVVKSANAATTVTIKDGVTVLIAGLIKDNKTKTVNKVPLLGDIPIIKKAFEKVSDEIIRTETIIFLTPRIVGGDKPFLMESDMPKEIKGVRK